MVSKRNLAVKRTGVSLMAETGEAGEEEETAAAEDGICLRVNEDDDADADAEDEGNKHLLYIVAVGRLNGTILHR